jgi:hypothetical protein
MVLMSANPNYRRSLMNRDYAEITANLTGISREGFRHFVTPQ